MTEIVTAVRRIAADLNAACANADEANPLDPHALVVAAIQLRAQAEMMIGELVG